MTDMETNAHRVLMTADTIGGVWTYALDLSRALSERGVKVMLATMGKAMTPAQRLQVAAVPGLELAESEYRLEWMDEPWADVAAAGRWLIELEYRFQPDVIHLNGYAHAALPWRAPTVVVGHSDVLSWWRAVREENAPNDWDKYRAAVSRGLRAASEVITPTAAMGRDLSQIYALSRQPRVIYNGVETGRYSPAEQKEPVIFAAGRVWDEAKNLAALQAIAPDLSWPVYVAGETQHPNGKHHGQGTHALGHLDWDMLSRWYSRAAIYALPARYEPFGLSVLEAALSGCALVLGDIPSLRELWSGCALFVPPSNTRALWEGIESLRADAGLRLSLSAQAMQRAQMFTIDRCADEYLDVYGALSAAGNPARLAG